MEHAGGSYKNVNQDRRPFNEQKGSCTFIYGHAMGDRLLQTLIQHGRVNKGEVGDMQVYRTAFFKVSSPPNSAQESHWWYSCGKCALLVSDCKKLESGHHKGAHLPFTCTPHTVHLRTIINNWSVA